MTELEKADHDVACAKRAANVADWKALEAKATYTRLVAASYEAEAELQAARIRLADAERDELAAPAPVEDEPGIPDALGEFMKREGAVEWKPGISAMPPPEALVEVLFGRGDTATIEQVEAKTLDGPVGERGFLRAYRVVSIPDSGTWYQEAVDRAAAKAVEDAAVDGEEDETGLAEFLANPNAVRVDADHPEPVGRDFAGFWLRDELKAFILLDEPSDYFPTQPFTIGASKPHADESDAQMFAAGINRELEKA